MSEEIKEIIDKIKQEEFPYALAIAKAYEKLQQENKHLKEKLDIADTNYDIIYDYFSKVNELLGTELCEEVLTEILKLKSENEELKKALENKRVCYYNNKAYDIKTLLNKNDISFEFEQLKAINQQIKELDWYE